MNAHAYVTNDRGVTFAVRIVKKGEGYGVGDKLVASDDFVEFYDTRHKHTPIGQFVSRYCFNTLYEDRDRLATRGLCLDGGVPDWNITAENFVVALRAADVVLS